MMDRFLKTVALPAQVRDGRLQYLYGGPLPALREGTVVDLIVPTSALLDQSLLGPLTNHLQVPVLPARSRLLVGLKPNSVVAGSESIPPHESPLNDCTAYFAVFLESQLNLFFRGTKPAVLAPCPCHVPVLDAENPKRPFMAGSLNQAYTALSERFETHRPSHTGNAFLSVFFRGVQADGTRRWQPLQDLRDRMQAKLEERFRGLLSSHQDCHT